MLGRDTGNCRLKMLEMELASRRIRGRPQRRLKKEEDIKVVGVTVEVRERVRWRQVVSCGNRKQPGED